MNSTTVFTALHQNVFSKERTTLPAGELGALLPKEGFACVRSASSNGSFSEPRLPAGQRLHGRQTVADQTQ